MRMEFSLFGFLCVCIGSGLCDEMAILSEESCRVCVCDLGTSTNSHSSPQFGCSTTENKINFTYRHWKSNRRLLPAPRQCGCFSRVDPFVMHISESAVRVASNHISTIIPDRRDSHDALHYASLLRPI